LVEKLGAQRLLGRSRHSFGDNNTTDPKGLRQESKEWFNVARDRENWLDL
jgi:23S rRNA U2552 (ribose-2'-O)-methylase RlmE/FtsJ